MKAKNILTSAGLITAGIVAGTVISMAGTANAADPATGSSTTVATSTTAPVLPSFGAPDGSKFNPGGAASVRSDETVVTGDDATKLKDAALTEVPGATVIRVETDGDGAAYEVHLQKSDGTLVTVKFDKGFKVTAVEDGMGAGGPGGHAPDNDGDGPAPTQSN